MEGIKMEVKSNKFLKVTGILMIIGGALGMILGLIAVLVTGFLIGGLYLLRWIKAAA